MAFLTESNLVSWIATNRRESGSLDSSASSGCFCLISSINSIWLVVMSVGMLEILSLGNFLVILASNPRIGAVSFILLIALR